MVTKKARQLTKDDRKNPIICYLFEVIKPERVFVHGNEPIRFFEEKTGCGGFTSKPKRACWQGHDFWLFGRDGPLYTLSIKGAADYGATLAAAPK
jgi:hypothetical protein